MICCIILMSQFAFASNDSIKKPSVRVSFKVNQIFGNCRIVGSNTNDFESSGQKNYRRSTYEEKISSVTGNKYELKANLINISKAARISLGLFYSTNKFQTKTANYDEYTEFIYGHGPPGNYVVDSSKFYYNGTDIYKDHISMRGMGGSLGINFQKQIRLWILEGDVMFMMLPKMKSKVKREYISTWGTSRCGRQEEFELDLGRVFGMTYNIGFSCNLYKSLWVSGGVNYSLFLSEFSGNRYYSREGVDIHIKNFNQFGANLGLALVF